MKNAFSADSGFMRFLDRVSDLFILSVITALCCIPIVTIGASVTAMYHITLRMADGKDGRVIKPFFKSFAENFRKSTAVWLLIMLVAAVVYGDWFILYQTDAEIPFILNRVITISGGALVLITLFVGSYVFALLARFENTLKNTLKNALIISVMNIMKTLLLIVINLAPIVIGFVKPLLWAPMLLLAFGGSSFLASKIYLGIFFNVEKNRNSNVNNFNNLNNLNNFNNVNQQE